MIHPDNRLFCRLDGLSTAVREQRRSQAMQDLGLLESDSIPVFEEATQMATHFLDMPISILGLMTADAQKLKSAVGLSRLGPMNDLAQSRRCPRLDSFCTHVVDSLQTLAIPDTFAHPGFAGNILVHQYGVRAYLGVPLIASNGYCVGTLAVMDQNPRTFTQRDVEFLQLTARWGMSEFERQRASQALAVSAIPSESTSAAPQPPDMLHRVTAAIPDVEPGFAHRLTLELLAQLTQELRTPLTSVMGMTSVLLREIYGPLTTKQKEYLDIIHNSGHYLLSLVNEILELSTRKDCIAHPLRCVAVDVEMLSQQVIGSMQQAAQRREQKIRLSVEPGYRIWHLDREKVRQILYHLLFSVIQSSNSGSTVCLHISHKHKNLNIAVWVSHPWLGEGLAYTSHPGQPALTASRGGDVDWDTYFVEPSGFESKISGIALDGDGDRELTVSTSVQALQDRTFSDLGLLLCQQLAEGHGGCLTIQESAEFGYRYGVTLPQGSVDESL